jgi:hypothetical protein
LGSKQQNKFQGSRNGLVLNYLSEKLIVSNGNGSISNPVSLGLDYFLGFFRIIQELLLNFIRLKKKP